MTTTGEGSPALNMALFLVFVAITLVIVFRVARTNRTTTDFFAAGRTFTGGQNGTAIAGDYLSAASFLGVAGAIAIYGFDGFLYAIGFLVAWLVALLLVAEMLRNTGRFTMADVLAFRLREGPVRIAAAISTLAVCLFYLLAQMVGAGSLVNLLLGENDGLGQSATIALVGILMIVYVFVGGMRGTTWVQIIKFALLIAGAVLMSVWVLGRYGFNFSDVLGAAADRSPQGSKILAPMAKYGASTTTKVDFISLSVALVLGTAALPHVLMRFYTVPSAKVARRSVTSAIGLIGLFYLCSLVLGFGAAALVGPEKILAAPGKENAAVPLLAYELGGTLLLGVISAVAFATILAVVAGLTIATSAALAHDVYAHAIKKGDVTPQKELRVAKITSVVIGVLALVGGITAKNQNVAFLVALAFAVAASANLPTLLYSLFWKGFTTRGALWSIYGGLVASIGLIAFSPVVSGAATSIFPGANFAWFPLSNPGLVSIPIAFLLGWLGSVTGRASDSVAYAEMEVRALTGAGAERAVPSGGDEAA